jgi:hypothetical protein
MVFETLVFSPFNHLTRLIVRENFIILSRRESNKSQLTICPLPSLLTVDYLPLPSLLTVDYLPPTLSVNS